MGAAFPLMLWSAIAAVVVVPIVACFDRRRALRSFVMGSIGGASFIVLGWVVSALWLLLLYQGPPSNTGPALLFGLAKLFFGSAGFAVGVFVGLFWVPKFLKKRLGWGLARRDVSQR